MYLTERASRDFDDFFGSYAPGSSAASMVLPVIVVFPILQRLFAMLLPVPVDFLVQLPLVSLCLNHHDLFYVLFLVDVGTDVGPVNENGAGIHKATTRPPPPECDRRFVQIDPFPQTDACNSSQTSKNREYPRSDHIR